MKKLFLAFGILIASLASAAAACTPPAVMHDFPGTSFNMSMVTAADGNCASSTSIQPGGVASGAVSSGAYAAGALAAGAFASGAGVDGWDLTQGAKADALCAVPTSTTACSVISLLKALTNVANSATPVTDQVGGAVTPLVGDPCQTTAKSFLPITATTSLVKVIATGVAAKKIYVCQLILTTTAANNVAVFEATTATTCATSPVAVYGAGTSVATAANGFPFPANGGISLGNGASEVAQTTVNNNDLCIGTSAATPLTGGILYVTR